MHFRWKSEQYFCHKTMLTKVCVTCVSKINFNSIFPEGTNSKQYFQQQESFNVAGFEPGIRS